MAAVDMIAIGISRRGLGVSSARLAAVSKPTNSSTPYSTPKKMPDQPSDAEDGLNGATLLAEPSLTMTVMKKISTTSIDTRARASWLRVDSRTPKYRNTATSAISSTVQAQDGSGLTPNSARMVLCR